MGRLGGKVVLITGGARGQGACEAQMFAAEGACVAVADILDAEGGETVESITQVGGVAAYVHLDVSREDDWHEAVGAVVQKFGRLDVLVNNAGINIRRTIEEMSAEEWDTIFEVNLRSVFLGTKAVAPAMRRSGGGSIVNIASTGGMIGVPQSAAYTATKGGIRAFTKSAALQYAAEGIRCNTVNPGPVATDFLRELLEDRDRLEQRENQIPLGRLAAARDVAFAVLYLASDESAYVTGTELVVDGGLTAS